MEPALAPPAFFQLGIEYGPKVMAKQKSGKANGSLPEFVTSGEIQTWRRCYSSGLAQQAWAISWRCRAR